MDTALKDHWVGRLCQKERARTESSLFQSPRGGSFDDDMNSVLKVRERNVV